MKMEGGHKDDAGKIRPDLIPAITLIHLAGAFRDGAAEHGERNWEKGIKYSRLYAALMRHLLAWASGEDWDIAPDGTKKLHLTGVVMNAIFLLTFALLGGRQDLDDRRTP